MCAVYFARREPHVVVTVVGVAVAEDVAVVVVVVAVVATEDVAVVVVVVMVPAGVTDVKRFRLGS